MVFILISLLIFLLVFIFCSMKVASISDNIVYKEENH